MNNDWDAWKLFLVLAECGSLNVASQRLGCSQPTLSRRLSLLEDRVGKNLFDRSTQGLSLTEFGSNLLEECENMADCADRIQRIVHGQDISLSGTVKLSVNEMIAQYYLPPIVPTFMETYPDLQLKTIVTNTATNLDKRDADVAIRMFRPHQPNLVTRHLANLELGAYASSAYIDNYGEPKKLQDFKERRILGFDKDKQLEEDSLALGWPIKNRELSFRTDNMPFMVEVAVNGGGIIFTHSIVARKRNLKRLKFELEIPPIPLYLTCHRDVRQNRKIKALMKFISEQFEDLST
ncbi:transcriptional regulator [Salinivibrio sp. SS3]|uniref:LysR family transcriptional regulator n=1 Tax=Salinivibrio TaxID=51366 RepID=UPI000847EAA2|nr:MULTISPECIES: LysR family transcriptional regulator [Salinivibrio]ODP96211.1 transcriptional regulator [Salinivibrio sp. BNH]WBA13287.1 LysR family transcriptional regulator [Salinivibrio kushneri]